MSDLKKLCGNRGIHITHLNIHSLKKNIEHARALLNDCGVHLFGISESWLHDGIEDSIVAINGYDILRCDRIGRRGGGICVYVLRGLNYSYISELSSAEPELEYITVRINLPHTRPIFVVNIYRAPDTDIDDTFRRLNCIVDRISDFHTTPEVHILGDININVKQLRNAGVGKFRNFCRTHSLINLVNEPTHDGGGWIDINLTNRLDIIRCNEVLHMGISDHSLLYSNRKKAPPDLSKIPIRTRTFKKFEDGVFETEI